MSETRANLGTICVLDSDKLEPGHMMMLEGQLIVVENIKGENVFLRAGTRFEYLQYAARRHPILSFAIPTLLFALLAFAILRLH
jgi:hypothetical protein